MKGWIFNNFWIKIFSLILAVITWLYINEEITKESLVSKKYYKTLPQQNLQNCLPLEKNKITK